MIVLDTNVLSEAARPSPDPAVARWLDTQPRQHLFTTTVSVAEMHLGVRLLPQGQRRETLSAFVDRLFRTEFAGLLLSFDIVAAEAYAEIAAHRQRKGRPIAFADGQIAAIARSCDMAVATRNITDFEDCGLDLINPWAA